jgi:hypothetical protein
MSQSITAPRVGVSSTELIQNAAMHAPRDRSTIKGVTLAEATANAIQNTQLATE